MLAGFRCFQIGGLGAGAVDQFLQDLRVLQHRTRLEEVVVERLSFLVCHKQRLLQTFEQGLFLDVGAGIVDEDTRFHIAVGVDMAVTFAACHAAVHKFTVVLEVDGEQFLAALDPADISDLVIHVFSLFRTQEQIGAGVVADRHIMEEPCEDTTLVDQHIQEFIAGDRQIILAGVTDGNAERDMMFVHQIHGCERFVIMTCASSAVVAFFESLNADGNEEVADSQKVLTEFLVDQRAVGERVERHIFMFLAEFDDVILADQRFAARKKISVNAEFLALGDDLIHHFVGKIHLIAVFRGPASGAVQIACGGRVHQNDPRNIASVFFLHCQGRLISHKSGFKSSVQ